MEIGELLERLDSHYGSFPHSLIAAVIARRDEAIPEFLEILSDIDRNPESWLEDEDTMVHIYAMYALALFRETRAYPLLVRIFSRPGEFVLDLTGDAVLQDGSRILASVCGGDTDGITSLIEDEQVNGYVRSIAMDAMVSLVATGQRTRDDVMAYFLQLFHKFERKAGYQWDGLANVCCDLWPQEAMGELRRTYEEGLVDPQDVSWEDIEHDLALGKDGALAQTTRRGSLITDLSRDMSWMQCFEKPEPEPTRREVIQGYPSVGYATSTVHRATPKIGRNDPCSCGSGKKFKKCCGANEGIEQAG